MTTKTFELTWDEKESCGLTLDGMISVLYDHGLTATLRDVTDQTRYTLDRIKDAFWELHDRNGWYWQERLWNSLKLYLESRPGLSKTLKEFPNVKIVTVDAEKPEERICVECGHICTVDSNPLSHALSSCDRHRNVVTGGFIPCSDARCFPDSVADSWPYADDADDCGPDGAFWTPINKSGAIGSEALNKSMAGVLNRAFDEDKDVKAEDFIGGTKPWVDERVFEDWVSSQGASIKRGPHDNDTDGGVHYIIERDGTVRDFFANRWAHTSGWQEIIDWVCRMRANVSRDAGKTKQATGGTK